jgi:hypothetical protein
MRPGLADKVRESTVLKLTQARELQEAQAEAAEKAKKNAGDNFMALARSRFPHQELTQPMLTHAWSRALDSREELWKQVSEHMD